jgi:hypothetical protein
MVQKAKYFSIIFNTVPDITHTKQLTFIIRFVHHNKNTNKHFLRFCSVEDTTGRELHEFILNRVLNNLQ